VTFWIFFEQILKVSVFISQQDPEKYNVGNLIGLVMSDD